MSKTSDTDRKRIIQILKAGDELPVDYKHILFPPFKRMVFLIHAVEDREAAEILRHELIKAAPQLEVFMASASGAIRVGEEWFHTIKDNLMKSEEFIVFLTPTSLESKWVWFEVGAAWARECPLYPVTAGGLRKSEIPQPISPFQAISLETSEGLLELFERIGGTLLDPNPLANRIKSAMEKAAALPPERVPTVLKDVIDNAPVFGVFPAAEHRWHFGGQAVKDQDASLGLAWQSGPSDPTGDVVFGPYAKLPIRGRYEAWFRIRFQCVEGPNDQEVIHLDVSYHGVPVRIALRGNERSGRYNMYHGVFDFEGGVDTVELKVRKTRACHLWVDFTAITKPLFE